MVMGQTPNSKSQIPNKSQIPISSHLRDPCYELWNWILKRCSLFGIEVAVAQIRISGFELLSGFGFRPSDFRVGVRHLFRAFALGRVGGWHRKILPLENQSPPGQTVRRPGGAAFPDRIES